MGMFELPSVGEEKKPNIVMPDEIKKMIDPGKKRSAAEGINAEVAKALERELSGEDVEKAKEAARNRQDSEPTFH